LLYAALDQGQRLDWWRSGTFVALVISGSFLVLCAGIHRLSQPNPLVNFPFLRRRNTVLLGLTVASFRFVLLAGVVLVPSYLAVVAGYRPEQTGPVLLWLAIPQLLAGFFAVYLMGRIDARLILAAGFSLIAIGCAMNARISSAWSGNSFFASQLVLSLGEGLAFNGMVGYIILDIMNSGSLEKPADVLTFAGFFQTDRLFGGEVGASFIQFFLHRRLVFHADLLLAGIERGAAPVVERSRLLYGGMHAQAATRDIAAGRAAILFGGGLQLQAYTQSVMDGFTMIAYTATGCLLIVVCLKALRMGFRQLIGASTEAKSSS
jgi:DHA2 family multidrug resistance protein